MKMSKIIIYKSSKHISIVERHSIIQEYLRTQCTKQSLWYKYTGQTEEHGQIVKWMRKLGYLVKHPNIGSTIATTSLLMSKQQQQEKDFTTLQLENRIAALEKQLKEAELKAIAFSTMVDIAEKEFKIPIRKKFSTKP